MVNDHSHAAPKLGETNCQSILERVNRCPSVKQDERHIFLIKQYYD